MSDSLPSPPPKLTYRRWVRETQLEEDRIRRLSYRICVDETGQETWAGHPCFGFAGVAGFGPELARAQGQWRAMKRLHFGDAERPLHASGQMMTRPQLDAISHFFRTSRLRRFAFLMYAPPILPEDLDALKAMRGFLREELVAHIASLPKLPDDIAVVFETSERLLPKILDTFPGLKFSVVDEAGASLNIEREIVFGFAEKGVGYTWLEMADQVAHRAQRQLKAGFASDEDLMPEFRAAFPDPQQPHAKLVLMKLASIDYAERGVRFDIDEGGAVRVRFSGDGGAELARHWAMDPGIG